VTAAASAAASASAAATTATSLANAAKARAETAVQPTALDAVRTTATNAATAATAAQTAADNARLKPRIIQAWWGTLFRGKRDIRDMVEASLRSGDKIACSNSGLGDPAVGWQKECNISYELSPGIAKTIRVPENNWFDPALIPFSRST